MPRLPLLATFLLLLPLAACVESKDAVTLKADGSGTIVSTYAVNLVKMRELIDMYSVLQGNEPGAAGKMKDEDLPNAVAPAWFREAAADVKGYEIKTAKEGLVEGRRTTTVKASFTTLEAAARGGAFFSSSVTLSRVKKSEKAPKGAWKLTIKNALSGADPSAMGGMDPTTLLAMVQEQVKDLKIDLSIALPTRVLAHNGTKSEETGAISWSVTYDKIAEGKDLTMAVTFEASDTLKLKPFTYKPDMQKLAKRAMRKPPKAKKKPAPKADPKKGPPDAKPADPKGSGTKGSGTKGG